jgi:hypothetical protein
MNEIRLRPAPGQFWKHRKEATYQVLGITSEPDEDRAHKHPVTVFYQGADGRRWTRPLESWLRNFVPLKEVPPVTWDGQGLPPIGCDVMFHSGDNNVVGTVTGYGVRPSLDRDPFTHRVDINLVYKGTDVKNQRMLMDIRPTVPVPQKDFDSME